MYPFAECLHTSSTCTACCGDIIHAMRGPYWIYGTMWYRYTIWLKVARFRANRISNPLFKKEKRYGVPAPPPPPRYKGAGPCVLLTPPSLQGGAGSCVLSPPLLTSRRLDHVFRYPRLITRGLDPAHGYPSRKPLFLPNDMHHHYYDYYCRLRE